jgi:hypothetical protein
MDYLPWLLRELKTRSDIDQNLQFLRIASLGANVTTYTGTEPADTWVYRVQAFNGVGASGYSNNVTVRVR